jgi:hypothetical protein
MKNNWILNLGILLSLALALVINPVAAEQLGDSAMLAQDGQINLPANALNFDKASTVITQYSTGLRWQATYLDGVFWETPRPIDWDGISNVELRLYFLPMTSTVGNVDFFIRPRAYNPGDAFGWHCRGGWASQPGAHAVVHHPSGALRCEIHLGDYAAARGFRGDVQG